MIELKSCPFGGGEVRMWYNIETENYDIECQMCGCDIQQHYGCKDKARIAWNTRTTKNKEMKSGGKVY